MRHREIYEILTVYQSKIISSVAVDYEGRTPARLTCQAGPEARKKNDGIIRKIGLRKIEKRLTAWLTCMIENEKQTKKKDRKTIHLPTFITLTLSDDTDLSDRALKKKLLEVFLKRLQYNYGVSHYFWKAEKQKNGRLHIHLVVDRYIDKKEIQTHWNSIQNKHGLIDNYEKKYGNTNPPSTHVRAIKNQDKQIDYIMKYVRKNDSKLLVGGSVYRFSRNLINLKPFSFIPTGQDLPMLSQLYDEHCTADYNSDWFSIYYFDICELQAYFDPQHCAQFREYYRKMYKSLYDSTLVEKADCVRSNTGVPSGSMSHFPVPAQTSIHFPLG